MCIRDRNITATSTQEAILLQWSAHPTISQAQISGYKIYNFNSMTNEKVLLAELDNNNLSHLVENLDANTDYEFVITAQTDSYESGFAYPVFISTK